MGHDKPVTTVATSNSAVESIIGALAELESDIDGMSSRVDEMKKRLLAQSNEEVDKLKQQVTSMASEEAKRIVDGAKAEAEAESAQISKEAEKSLATIKKNIDASFDKAVESIVAEITNTPWGERHTYVLTAAARDPKGGLLWDHFAKAFHVSPFMPMDQRYAWELTAPGKELRVRMSSHRDGEQVFEAALSLQRAPISGPVLAGCLARHPWMTASVVAGIYWQAFRLWLRGVPFHVHPAKRSSDVPPVLTR